MARREKRPYTPDAPEWENWIVTVDRFLDHWQIMLEHIQQRGGIAAMMHDWPEANKLAVARQMETFGDQWKQLAFAIYATCETVDTQNLERP